MPELTLPDISEYEGGGGMEAKKMDLSRRRRARKLPHPKLTRYEMDTCRFGVVSPI